MGGDIPWLHDVQPDAMRRIVEALYRVHRLISVITDLNTLLERILEEGQRVAGAEASSLLLYDDTAKELYFEVARGQSGDHQALKGKVRLKLNEGIAGAAAASRQAVNVAEAAKDERFFHEADEITRFKTRSLLAVPMLDRETLVGVIEVVNKTGGGSFTETDLHVMEIFASVAGTSIANARLIEENLRAERMAAVGQAVAGLSHHVKNIMASMSGGIEMIDGGIRDHSYEIIETAWPIFKRAARRISMFVQDMLAYSKPREPVRQICEVRRLLEEAAEALQGVVPPKGLTLHINTDGVGGLVSVDPQGIFSCLMNLLTNAADAVPAGSGKIELAGRTTDDRELVVEVSDNGPGVPAALAHQVFEPFFSTKGTTGTGLGLAVTKKIVQEHGGTVAVEPAPDGGALFRMVFPGARVGGR